MHWSVSLNAKNCGSASGFSTKPRWIHALHPEPSASIPLMAPSHKVRKAVCPKCVAEIPWVPCHHAALLNTRTFIKYDLQKISSEATSVEDLAFCRGSLWHHERSYIASELQDFLRVFSQVCADASKDSGHEDLYSRQMFFVCPTKGLHEKWILQGTAWCQQFVQLYVWEPASHQRKITEHYLDIVIPSSSGIASWSAHMRFQYTCDRWAKALTNLESTGEGAQCSRPPT